MLGARGAAPLRCTRTRKCILAATKCHVQQRIVLSGSSRYSRCCAGYQQVPPSMLNFTPEELAQLMDMASEMTPKDRRLFMESILQLQAESAAAQPDMQEPWDASQALSPDMMDQPQSQYDNGVDEEAFWGQPQNNVGMWSVLQQFLAPEEVALVNRLVGSDWASSGTLDTGNMMQQAADMSPADRGLLMGIMSKMQKLQQDVEGGIIDVTDMVQGATAAAPSSSSRSAAGQHGVKFGIPGPQPATYRDVSTAGGPMSSSAAAAERTSGQASTSGRNYSSSSSSSRRRRGGSGPLFNRAGNDSSASALVSSSVRSANAPRRGDAVWGCPPSQDLVTLQQVHEQLAILSDLDEATMVAEGWGPDDVASAVEFCNESMVALMDKVAAGQEQPGAAWDVDDATQSVLLWMDAVMRNPEEGGLEVTQDTLQQMEEVLAAAENLEVVKAYVSSLASIKPQHRQLPQLLEDAGFGSPDWFVAPEQQQTALEAVAAAAEGAPDGDGTTPEGFRASVAGVLRPFVSRERIQMLAGLDGDSLRFAVDLQKTRFRQDTFMKWSMHPRIGPMLLTGNWVSGDQLPDLLAWLYQEGGLDALGLALPGLEDAAREAVQSDGSSTTSSSGGGSSSGANSSSSSTAGEAGSEVTAAAAAAGAATPVG